MFHSQMINSRTPLAAILGLVVLLAFAGGCSSVKQTAGEGDDAFAKENWDLLSSDMGLVNNTVISIAEDNDGGSTSEISVFEDLGLFGGPKTSLDTEIGILKSKTLIEKVIKEANVAFENIKEAKVKIKF